MKHQYLIGGGIAIAVLATVTVLFWPRGVDESSTQGRAEPSGEAALLHREDTEDEPTNSKKDRPQRGTLEELRKLGFTITADRIGPSTAEGGVKITGPDGTAYWGDDFRVSSKDDFLLTGSVGMKEGNMSLEAGDEDLIIRVSFDGSAHCSPGRWITKTTMPNKTQ